MARASKFKFKRDHGPVEIITSATGVGCRLECSSCGVHETWQVGRIPPADQIPKHFVVKGWNLRRAPVCPSCVASQKRAKSMNSTVTQISTNPPAATSLDICWLKRKRAAPKGKPPLGAIRLSNCIRYIATRRLSRPNARIRYQALICSDDVGNKANSCMRPVFRRPTAKT